YRVLVVDQASCISLKQAGAIGRFVQSGGSLICIGEVGIRDLRGVPHEIGSSMDALLRSEEHTSELQSRSELVCRLLLEKKKFKTSNSFAKVIKLLSDSSKSRAFSTFILLSRYRPPSSLSLTLRCSSNQCGCSALSTSHC